MADAITPVNVTPTQVATPGATGTPVSPQFQSKLLAAGVPQATIDQGREAVHSYVQSNPAIKATLEAEKKQQQGIFDPQQQPAQGAHKGHHGNHRAEIQSEAQALVQQNPGMTQQQAIQQVIAQFKAAHAASEGQEQQAPPPVAQ